MIFDECQTLILHHLAGSRLQVNVNTLGFSTLVRKVNGMSAAELIKQVDALPPEEKAAFMKMVRKMENGSHEQKVMNGQQWPDFHQRLHQIYGDKIAPDSQSIIDEGRGDR